jgi:pimeloyl-ACP methyl ester carboxylesterase
MSMSQHLIKILGVLAGIYLLLAIPRPAFSVVGDRIYTKPGQLIAASDGAQLNFYCTGTGTPTVIFDAGHGDWSPSWSIVQPRVSEWARACSYDRAGAGFSSAGPLPRTAQRMAEELHSALQHAGIGGPYILVGHATGAYTARAFADEYLRDVAGMILIEGDARDVETSAELRQLWKGINARNSAEMHLCRDWVQAGKPLPMPPPLDHPGWTCDDYFFRHLPEAKFSAALNAKLLEIVATKVALYDSVISEIEARPTDDAYLRKNRKSLGSRPLRVITSAHHITDPPDMPAARHLEHVRFNELRKQYQGRLLTLSSNSKQILTDTGAYVQLDQPQIVIDAIRDVFIQSGGTANAVAPR